jgi:VanZ family protein
MGKFSNRAFRTYTYAFAWAGFILFATIVNTSTLEKLSLQNLFTYDKPIHIFLFGTQAVLSIRAQFSRVYKSYKAVVIWCCVLSALYGLLTEVLQGWITTSRTFDYYDFIADCIGCLIVCIWYLSKRKAFAQLTVLPYI